MKTKEQIVENWLPRYTGLPLEAFGDYILLTNFDNYVKKFAAVAQSGSPRPGQGHAQCYC